VNRASAAAADVPGKRLGALKLYATRPSNLFRFFFFFFVFFARSSHRRNYLRDRAQDSYTLDPNPFQFREMQDTF